MIHKKISRIEYNPVATEFITVILNKQIFQEVPECGS